MCDKQICHLRGSVSLVPIRRYTITSNLFSVMKAPVLYRYRQEPTHPFLPSERVAVVIRIRRAHVVF